MPSSIELPVVKLCRVSILTATARLVLTRMMDGLLGDIIEQRGVAAAAASRRRWIPVGITRFVPRGSVVTWCLLPHFIEEVCPPRAATSWCIPTVIVAVVPTSSTMASMVAVVVTVVVIMAFIAILWTAATSR